MDKTQPSISDNIFKGRYEGDSKKVEIEASDNLALDKFKVVVDGKEVVNIDKNEKSVYKDSFTLKKGEGHKIEMIAVDKAGNINKIEKEVSIGSNPIMIYLLIAGACAAAGLGAFFLIRKKNKKNKKKN